jgi:steroid 5-alpha reductase family enzyme
MSLPVVQVRPWSGFAIVGFAYVIAYVAGTTVVRALAGWPALEVLALADLVATVVVFVFSRAYNNSSVYDPYWSVAPPVLALGLTQGWSPRALLILTIITIYAVRLTWNWARGWSGLGHEDWRYVDIRNKTGRLYWPAAFFGLHFFPSVMVFLGCLPLVYALGTGQPEVGLLDAVAALVTLGAIAIEGAADNQLRAYRQAQHGTGICDQGLWRYSRHPNYFGELSFWLGLFLFGQAVGAPLWTGVGIVAMIGLFVGASIPMAEKRSLARRPHYAEHQRTTSMLIPWFRKS